MKISARTKIVGIFGYPIYHSLSPIFHNAAFAKLGLDFIYFPFSVKPKDLKEAVQAIKSLDIEPEFISALYFLHNRFNYFSDEEKFKNRIDKILKKAKNLDCQPGTYLDNLFKVP